MAPGSLLFLLALRWAGHCRAHLVGRHKDSWDCFRYLPVGCFELCRSSHARRGHFTGLSRNHTAGFQRQHPMIGQRPQAFSSQAWAVFSSSSFLRGLGAKPGLVWLCRTSPSPTLQDTLPPRLGPPCTPRPACLRRRVESEGMRRGRRALLRAWTWLLGGRGTGPEERPGTERELCRREPDLCWVLLLWLLGLEFCFPDHLSAGRLAAGAIDVLLIPEICSLRASLCPEPGQLCCCEAGLRAHMATELWSVSVSVSAEPLVTERPEGLLCRGLLRPGGWVPVPPEFQVGLRGGAGLHRGAGLRRRARCF